MTDALRDGELTVEGRLTEASNATLYCLAVLKGGEVDAGTDAASDNVDTANASDSAGTDSASDSAGTDSASDNAGTDDAGTDDAGTDSAGTADPASTEVSLACVYKPIAGENPLWDFPDGTLAAREVAAYEVSVAAGWNVVPLTIMRDGPFGPGMCQTWIETVDESSGLLAILPERGGAPDGWCPIVAVGLEDDRRGLLAHRDDAALRRVALFDVVINNADRKGGHLLPGVDGHLYAIDHGVSFHVEDKLRTLLWGFAGRELTDDERAELNGLRADGDLAVRLSELLTAKEIEAFHGRIDALLKSGRLPGPEGRRRPIPWPLV